MRRMRCRLGLALVALLGCAVSTPTAPQDFTVEGRVALASLATIADAHLDRIGGDLALLASRDEVRSADWARIRDPLAVVAQRNVPALAWFALADGSYWSVQDGRASGNLSDRAYWPRLMAGKSVVGDLVVSKATGKCSAIVAVPVRDAGGAVVGALGTSVFLDSLSLIVRRELDLQPNEIFFSIDSTPLVALNGDSSLIFAEPLQMDEPELQRAIREMLSRDAGVVNYAFRGRRRTVLYRKSNVTGWWYAFGRVWK